MSKNSVYKIVIEDPFIFKTIRWVKLQIRDVKMKSLSGYVINWYFL